MDIEIGATAALPLLIVCPYCTAVDSVPLPFPVTLTGYGDLKLERGWMWAAIPIPGRGVTVSGIQPTMTAPVCPTCVHKYFHDPIGFQRRQSEARDLRIIPDDPPEG